MSVSSSTAYLLVFHGSRDPRPGQAMERLAKFVRSHLQQFHTPASLPLAIPRSQGKKPLPAAKDYQQIELFSAQPDPKPQKPQPGKSRVSSEPSEAFHFPLVGTACLETGLFPLHQQIVDFSRRVRATGATTIRIVPLFLAKGVHVMEDIPAEVQQAREVLPEMELEICEHLGSHPGLKQLLRKKLQLTGAEELLVLAHGSRRPGGNAAVHALARTLGGSIAFWSVAPNLETQVIQLMQEGLQRLVILPYFLFAGSTTDAITQATEELAERFPKMGFHLLAPIGPSPELACLVGDLALQQVPPKPQQPPLPMKRIAFKHYTPSSLVS